MELNVDIDRLYIAYWNDHVDGQNPPDPLPLSICREVYTTSMSRGVNYIHVDTDLEIDLEIDLDIDLDTDTDKDIVVDTEIDIGIDTDTDVDV